MAARKVNAMPPPTISVSTFGASALSTSILSPTLAPPTTATKGRAGQARMPPSTSISRARRRPAALGQELRGTDDRGVAAVGHTEGLVHVGVEALDEGGHERRVVLLLPRREAQVLSELDPGTQGGEALPDRIHLPTRVGVAAGRPRCDAATTSAPWSCSQRSVGSAAVMRKSSATVARPSMPMCRGTLKSTRTSTRSPFDVGEVLEERQSVQWVHRVTPRPARSDRPGGWSSPIRCRTSPPP